MATMTYRGLLLLIEESVVEFKAKSFAGFKLLLYFHAQYNNPTDYEQFSIAESMPNGEFSIDISGPTIMSQMQKMAHNRNLDFGSFAYDFNTNLLETAAQRALIFTYEAINNYKESNNPNMFRELSRNDWFRMMRVLRDYFTHFYNIGRSVKFANTLPYSAIDEVSWNGLTIRKDQQEGVTVSPIYIMNLIDHCLQCLIANESTLK